MITVWEGVELPVWEFDTFVEFDRFMDTILGVEDEDTAGHWFQLAPFDGTSGILFSRPVPFTPGSPPAPRALAAAVAACTIREERSV